MLVAPFAGAWIEICETKCLEKLFGVAPFAGAWIEIQTAILSLTRRAVAPFAGAWIEISGYALLISLVMSLPSRERGLKYFYYSTCDIPPAVAPFAGAWIEMGRKEENENN